MNGREPGVPHHHPTRRDVLRMGLGAFLVSAVPFSWHRRTLVRRTVPVMGTIAEFAVLTFDQRLAQQAIRAAIDELRAVERTMSRFDPSSDIGRANRGAAADGVPISDDTALVLQEALRWAEASDGAFDPCIGKVLELWDVMHRHAPPPARQVHTLAARQFYRGMDVSRWQGAAAVRFTTDDIHVDLGGIAKGFAVDRAVAALRSRGIDRALINVGGDLYALGRAPSGDPWNIGIRSPLDPSRLAGTLELTDAAVATSGDYLQYFQYAGRRYHHLLDPRTAAPRLTPTHSVSVSASSCMHADAAATAIFGMRQADAERILAGRGHNARIVSSL